MIKIEIIPLCMFLIKKHVFSYFGQAQTYQNKSDPLCRGKGKLNNSVTTLWSWHRIKGIFNLYKRILVIKQATLSIQKIIPLDPLYLISIHLIIQSCHFLHFTTQHRHALLYYTKSQIFLSTLHPVRIWAHFVEWVRFQTSAVTQFVRFLYIVWKMITCGATRCAACYHFSDYKIFWSNHHRVSFGGGLPSRRD